MNEIIGVTVAFVVFEAALILMAKPKAIEMTYRLRMKGIWQFFLMPGRLAHKETWRSSQLMLIRIGIAFSAIVYCMILLRILKWL